MISRYLENLSNKLKVLFIIISIVFSIFASYLLFAFVMNQSPMDAQASHRMIVRVSPSRTSGTVPFSVRYTVSASPRSGFVGPLRWFIHCEMGPRDFDASSSGAATKSFTCRYTASQFPGPGNYTVRFRANVFELGHNCTSPWCDSTGVRINVTVPGAPPPPPPVATPPKGSLDVADCNAISGWAYDPDIPNQSINVHVYVNGTFFTALNTDKLRSDVNTAFGITGNHGYSMTTPNSLKDNTPKEIKVYAIDNGSAGNPLLSGSPKTITCAPPNIPPIGWLDAATCDTISGWAIDQDTPDSSIDVHIYKDGPFGGGGTFLISITTDQLRQDINDFFGITGDHGYEIPTPASLIDGLTHTIYAHGIDSGGSGPNPLLSGVPITLNTATCFPPPPTVSSVNITQPDYCASGPAATINWTYAGNSAQSAYRVVIEKAGVPILDSGKILSGSNTFFTGQGKLDFNTSYNTRVEVWDSDDVSNGLSGLTSFATPLHAFPQIDFSWTPQNIIPGENIQFTDESVVVTNPSAWLWDFGDGNISANQNPVHKYDTKGSKTVSFTVTDTEGFSCTSSQDLGINQEPPKWIEVLPR